ncbi:hypothetical protein C8F04DRAFT_111681 [Mycena alexandri]|uniref:DUF6697 domain-containing protein n=1 Tax=Mycena alexandri TaxID=1745969 RepID=A0AAD6TCR0_9AGAR|nr:hypothetical protein C8F04DRAFT_111681 [Mycena alexandri]
MSVVEMALEVEVERTRAAEALSARDAAIQRLSEAYVSLRQKITIIERLQQAPQPKPSPSHVNEQVVALEMTIKTLREELTARSTSSVPVKPADPPPSYNENGIDHPNPGHHPQLVRPASHAPLRLPRETLPPALPSPLSATPDVRIVLDGNDQVVYTAPKPEEIIKARHAMLASIPLPADPPDDCLKPIVIPPPFTLHEFLANASGSLRNALSNYRVLQELTTSWCPDREEHGYLLTPLFKCSTNPRAATAHRWNMVDVMARMSKPTECFYNKDGNWYYAGVYKAFRLEDLTTKEWEALSNETTQALVKDTIAGRKNTSPQNIYETSQLYAAGALRVACLGLQCVGFNKAMYHAVLEQAAKCAAAGKWKAGTPTSGTPPNAGLGAVGGTWNAAVEAVLDGNAMAGMSIGGSENVPVQGGKGKK